MHTYGLSACHRVKSIHIQQLEAQSMVDMMLHNAVDSHLFPVVVIVIIHRLQNVHHVCAHQQCGERWTQKQKPCVDTVIQWVGDMSVFTVRQALHSLSP